MAQAELGSAEKTRNTGKAGMFWRYWTASTASGVGDAVTTVALPLVAIETLHAGAFEVSLLPAARFVAWLAIGLPAGVIVQRLPLRGTQIAMDLIRAAAMAWVPLAAALGILRLWQLVLVTLVIGLAGVVFDVGNSTFLPSIVSKEELTARNSLLSGSSAATQLGAPSLGGVLVQFCGAATSLLVDAVSYVVSGVILWTVPRPKDKRAPAAAGSPWAQISEGWRYVTRHPVIRPCVTAATLVNFVCGTLIALTPLYLVRTLGTPVGLVGVVMATDGLGSLLGAALTPRLAARLGSARAIRWATPVGAVALVLLPLSSGGWGLLLFGLGNTVFTMGVVVLSILTRTHRQSVTPPELLPRVMATVRFVSWGAVPVGSLLAGTAAAGLGTRDALWLVGAVSLLAPLALWAGPVRRMRVLA
ncbi:MFS transporter [Streptomyces sp. TR1341]|uniref:MFS family permease n=1 Tax=Streptomyces murinus TaxID=33900 RepID=A0A7W3RPZ9_STRMR|nr:MULTISPECIES: MFS transporter [Streptomyces]MBA9056923.1 MFS family permease [Streptomyces murinus]NDK26831.1 MFS transporter [Streptomyces sp. TR1341]UWW91314.1 MFS transporter [Streptomyces murinus]WSI88559.1 MFS transporter [Streptomyces murinus]